MADNDELNENFNVNNYEKDDIVVRNHYDVEKTLEKDAEEISI